MKKVIINFHYINGIIYRHPTPYEVYEDGNRFCIRTNLDYMYGSPIAGDESIYRNGWTISTKFEYERKYYPEGTINIGDNHVSSISFSPVGYKKKERKGGIIVSTKLLESISACKMYCKKKDIEGDVILDMDYKELTDGSYNWRLNLSSKDNDPNCFDVRKGEVSYFLGVQPLNDEKKWDRKGRQVMKASKFVAILQPFFVGNKELFPRAMEILAEKIKGIDVFNILISDDPGKIYKTRTSSRESGTLGNSCMRPEADYKGNKYVDFYTYVNAKIVYILDDSKSLSARALLWENVVDTENGKKFSFVDRVYGSERHIQAILEWAEENGYWYKHQQSYSSNMLIKKDHEPKEHYRYHTGKTIDDFDGIPFLDTLEYYDDEYITTEESRYNIQTTDGGPMCNDDDNYDCDECGYTHDIDHMYEINSNYYCENCVVYSDEYNEYIVSNNAVSVINHGYMNEYDDNIVVIDGRYYHIDDTFCCDRCEETFPSEEQSGREDGCYCHDCDDELTEEETKKEEETSNVQQ